MTPSSRRDQYVRPSTFIPVEIGHYAVVRISYFHEQSTHASSLSSMSSRRAGVCAPVIHATTSAIAALTAIPLRWTSASNLWHLSSDAHCASGARGGHRARKDSGQKGRSSALASLSSPGKRPLRTSIA